MNILVHMWNVGLNFNIFKVEMYSFSIAGCFETKEQIK